MAKKFYAPVSGSSKEVKKFYAPVNGSSVKIVKAYCSVGGVSKCFYEEGEHELGVNIKTRIYDLYSGDLPITITTSIRNY